MANTFVSLRRLQQFYNGLKNKFALKSDIKTPDWNAQAITDETSGETTYEDGYIENKPAIRQGDSKYSVVEGFIYNDSSYKKYEFNIEVEPNSSTISYTTEDDLSTLSVLENSLLEYDLKQVDGTLPAKGATRITSIDKDNGVMIAEKDLNIKVKMSGTAILHKYWHNAKLNGSHAEGHYNVAYSLNSHAEGQFNVAAGSYAHTEGTNNTAYGTASHVEGMHNIVHKAYAHVQGKYSIEDKEGVYAHIVGNGSNKANRSNAHTLDWSGNSWYAGTVSAGTIASPATVTNNNDLTTKAYVDNAIDSMTLVFCTESEIDEMLAALGIVVDVVEEPVAETGGSD